MSPDGDITLLVTLRSHVLPHCCPSVSHCSHNGRSKLGDRNAEAVPAEGVNSSKSDRKIIISVRTAAEEFRHVWWGGTPACGAVARSRGLAPAVDPRGGGGGASPCQHPRASGWHWTSPHPQPSSLQGASFKSPAFSMGVQGVMELSRMGGYPPDFKQPLITPAPILFNYSCQEK